MSLSLELLGERIRFARERVGLSQEQVAQELGRDQRTISQYENGKRKIFVTDLPILANLFQVPVAFFFEGEDILDDFDKRILTEFHRLTDADAKALAIDLLHIFCNGINRETE